MESTRVIMLRNWHFDILNYRHWMEAWDLWLNSWVISEPKEWAFVLIIISFIPLWFTGWIALSLISWFKLFKFIVTLPWRMFKIFFYKPARLIGASAGISGVRRKKSYKEIRPRALKTSINDRVEAISPKPITIPSISPINIPSSAPSRGSKKAPAQPAKDFDHSLFKFDDSFDDMDFDIDSFEFNQEKPVSKAKSAPKNREYEVEAEEPRETRRAPEKDPRDKNKEKNREKDNRERDKNKDRPEKTDRPRADTRAPNRSREDDKSGYKDKPSNNAPNNNVNQRAAGGSCADIIKQKGYEVLNRIAVKNTIIDYIGVSNGKICLCLLDREPGDWLADEERFNDEEPLWFSENSHRISPVRKVDLTRGIILDRLAAADMSFEIEVYVVVQIGNIINAEDMFDIWNEMNINVTRIDRGTPKEMKLFARALTEADQSINTSKLDKVMKIIKDN